MKRMKTAGLCLVAVLSLGALVAENAAASLPELGRCVHVGKGGHFKGKKCFTPSPSGKGTYEWLPGPGKENHFYGVAAEPEPVLETVGGAKITCSAMVFEGEYTGPKTEKQAVFFSGCLLGGTKPCQTSPSKEGEMEATGIEGTLGFINKNLSKPKVGWDLKHEGGGLWTEYTCGSVAKMEVPVAYKLEGSVIGAIKHVDLMSEEESIKYTAEKGAQVPEAFENGMKETLLITNVVESKSSQAGLSLINEQESGLGAVKEKPENQEPTEIKALCKGEFC